MEAQKTIPGRWAFGTGLTRPLLAYVVVVAVGAWVYNAVQDLTQGSDLGQAVVAATTVLRDSLTVLPVLAVLLLPAMVFTIKLVHRFEANSIAARAVLGAASWVGWAVFGAINLVVASRVVLVPEVLASTLAVFAGAGAVYSVFSFDGYQTRPGKALTLLALAAATFVVLGSIWMAGRWGGPA
jgi:hypothetical protein